MSRKAISIGVSVLVVVVAVLSFGFTEDVRNQSTDLGICVSSDTCLNDKFVKFISKQCPDSIGCRFEIENFAGPEFQILYVPRGTVLPPRNRVPEGSELAETIRRLGFRYHCNYLVFLSDQIANYIIGECDPFLGPKLEGLGDNLPLPVGFFFIPKDQRQHSEDIKFSKAAQVQEKAIVFLENSQLFISRSDMLVLENKP